MSAQLLSVMLTLALLCSCVAPAGETQSPEPGALDDPDGLAYLYIQTILDSQADGESYTSLSPEDREFYLTQVYAIPAESWSGSAVYTMGGEKAGEIAVVRSGSGSDREALTQALEEYRKNRLADFVGYLPEQAAIVEKGRVAESGDWTALLLCEDVDAAEAAFKEQTGEALPAAEEEPAAAESAGLPDESPALDPRFMKDERGYLPFLPPNETDMTLYDITAILTAWTSGDRSALGEMDRRILEQAEKALEACGITEVKSDFEKELALHDWIVDNGHYDRTVHDPETPEGLPHNKDPYGLLVEGYGICLGYATTFQLLMELAGVECVTVVGASGWSREDHAWNMVRLEGEWYCVDVTWDDTTIADPSAYSREELSRRHHRYFNVTGNEMRSSNHQWDYDSVPEAGATRFRWDGTGALPQ